MPPTTSALPTVTTIASATTSTAASQPVGVGQNANQPPTSIEAKIVILGAQGVGKTSLVTRFLNPLSPLPTSTQATVGASFITKRIHDPDSNTTVRLQIWDTAGQERFRSISRLYYRGANAGLLCYDVTSEKSWEEMKGWLREMRENCDFASPTNRSGMVVHVVGTKTDLVAEDPDNRQVPFEKTITYVAEQLGGVTSTASQSSTPPMAMRSTIFAAAAATTTTFQSPDSKRSSGYWNQDLGWDSCHEISAKDNDGIEEVFRVIARKLIEQRNRNEGWLASQTPGYAGDHNNNSGGGNDYFTSGGGGAGGPGGAAGNISSNGSFRLGYGDKRRSWLGLPSVGLVNSNNYNNGNTGGGAGDDGISIGLTRGVSFGTTSIQEARKRGGCC